MASVPEIFKTMDYGPAPEDASTANAWLAQHTAFGHFIDGAWTKPANLFDSVNPATGEVLARISGGQAKDVDAAATAARAAQPGWAKLPGHQRAKHLYALARLIQKNARILAVLETLDNGKPIRESRDIDIALAARHFYHHAGWAQLLESEFPGMQPHGVCGQIIPWNFPLLMLSWKVAPALAAGNTVVLKPAEQTSLTALYFAELAQEAGLPTGALNIVTGAGETGAAIAEHPDMDKIAFTGSTDVGRLIRAQTAGSGKALTLELGGKSPFIVCADADLDAAVEGLVDAIWFNQGEVCCAGSRLLVEEPVAKALTKKIKHRLDSLRIGDPLDKAIDMGALIDETQKARIEGIVAASKAEGADVWSPAIDVPTTGSFLPPMLISDVGAASTAMTQEIFGPVLAMMTFRTTAEAVQLANNTRYGLAATVFTENVSRAMHLATEVKAGVVWINTTNAFDAACGFGGVRESGYGREGGREGMRAYLKPVQVTALAPKLKKASKMGAPARIDQSPKNYIGGKQTRPDGGNTMAMRGPDGDIIGRVGDGNRKDVRDAVEAASKAAPGWAKKAGHARAQILYYIAENLDYRRAEFEGRIAQSTGFDGALEVETCIARLFTYAAWADKYDGAVKSPPQDHVALAVHEPIGVAGALCPDLPPLLGLVSVMAPLIAMGNAAVLVASESAPLAATDFIQILETSDVPAGVVNIVTGKHAPLAKTLAEHDGVDVLWNAGLADQAEIERASTGNMKRVWSPDISNWFAGDAQGTHILSQSTQVKTIWLPYGD